jgi:hypothetical protein
MDAGDPPLPGAGRHSADRGLIADSRPPRNPRSPHWPRRPESGPALSASINCGFIHHYRALAMSVVPPPGTDPPHRSGHSMTAAAAAQWSASDDTDAIRAPSGGHGRVGAPSPCSEMITHGSRLLPHEDTKRAMLRHGLRTARKGSQVARPTRPVPPAPPPARGPTQAREPAARQSAAPAGSTLRSAGLSRSSYAGSTETAHPQWDHHDDLESVVPQGIGTPATPCYSSGMGIEWRARGGMPRE